MLGVKPSDLSEVYWSHTHHDLVTLVRLRTEYEMAHVYQDYESIRLVVAEALGGKSQTETTPEGVKPIQTFAELAAAFREIGGVVG